MFRTNKDFLIINFQFPTADKSFNFLDDKAEMENFSLSRIFQVVRKNVLN